MSDAPAAPPSTRRRVDRSATTVPPAPPPDPAPPAAEVPAQPEVEKPPFGNKDDLAATEVTEAVLLAAEAEAPAEGESPASTRRRVQSAPVSRPRLVLRQLEDVPEPVRVLYCGDGGTGKTSAMATMSSLGRVMWLDFEGGIKLSALNRLARDTGCPFDANNIVVSSPDGANLHDWLTEIEMKVAQDLRDDEDAWVGLVIDSLGESHVQAIQDAKLVGYRRALAKRTERDWAFIDRSDYGAASEVTRHHLRRFRDMPLHLACSTLLRREQDDDGKVQYMPGVTPAVQNDVIGLMDVVAYTSVQEIAGEDVYVGLVRAQPRYKAKDRFHALPRRVPDPWFSRLVGYIRDEISVETDEKLAEVRALVKSEEQALRTGGSNAATA